MEKTICLFIMFIQALCLPATAAEDETVTYSDISIGGILPENGKEITSAADREIIISFTGSVVIDKDKSVFMMADAGSPTEFESITALNDRQSVWGMFIPRDLMAKSTGGIKVRIYAYDGNGLPIRGNKGEYTELTYTCYLGVPDIMVSPADEYVEALEGFTFACQGGIAVNSDNDSDIILYGSDKSTVIQTITVADITGTEEEGQTGSLAASLSDAVSATGTYWLYIPNGFFLLGEDNIKSKYIWKEYKIEDAAHKYGVTLDPLNGSEVENLYRIKITFDNWNYAIPYYRNKKSIVMTDKDGNTVTEAQASVEENRSEMNQCVITLNTPVNTPGEYNLVIPDYAFILDESTNFHSDEMSFKYTVVEGDDPVANVTVRPAEGDVESLERIDLRFNGVTSVGIATGASPTAVLTDSEGTEIAKGEIKLGTLYTELYVLLDHKITGQSTYELRIPAGTIRLDNTVYAKDMTYTFRIVTTTGITGMGTIRDSKRPMVYDLTGRNIKSINVSGIYIVNGKKYITE